MESWEVNAIGEVGGGKGIGVQEREGEEPQDVEICHSDDHVL